MFVVKRFGFYENVVHRQIATTASSVAFSGYIEQCVTSQKASTRSSQVERSLGW